MTRSVVSFPQKFGEGVACRSEICIKPDDCEPGPCSIARCPILHDVGRTAQFKADETLFWEGDRADHVYLVVDGIVRTCRFFADGRRQIVRFAFPGDLMANTNTESYRCTAEAVTPLTVLALPRSAFNEQIEGLACLRRLVTDKILSELDERRSQVLLLGRMNAAERVAQFLVMLADHGDGEPADPIELPMSRADMADYLGLTVETVSRVLSRFKREGKIRMPSQNTIIPAALDLAIEARQAVAA